MSNDITIDQFKKALPKKCQAIVTPEMIDGINNLMGEQILRDNYRDNLLSYTSVMKDGRFKVSGYIDAIRYVSYKLIGDSNVVSYSKTFPDKYQLMVDQELSAKDINSRVSSFNKSLLVNKIFEQTLVPSHILNADLYQKALNVQAELMVSAGSEKVRTDAANSLLSHLKMPETTKIELDIGIKEDKTIEELRNSTMALVAQQKLMIQSGAMQVKEVAHSKLLIEDGEIVE